MKNYQKFEDAPRYWSGVFDDVHPTIGPKRQHDGDGDGEAGDDDAGLKKQFLIRGFIGVV